MSAAAPPPRKRDAERSRAALLDAAEELFARDGYERTSLEAIGAAAGLSRGTPRYFFGSKEDLYRAVLTRIVERAEAAGAAAEVPPGESLDQSVARYVRQLAGGRTPCG